jgi:hypothetical protein
MDYTKPIDIQAILNTAKKYDKDIKILVTLDAMDILKEFGLRTGFKESIDIHEFQHTFGVSKKYDGDFKGDKKIGDIVKRNLKIYPIVYEMKDEPERYRTTFLNEVATGKVLETTPFELWIIQRGIEGAAEELYNVLFTAVRSEDAQNPGVEYSFNGFETIIAADIVSGLISIAHNNLYDATTAFTAANIGDKLKAMWRASHQTMKRKGGIMYLAENLGEMYDDWYKTNHENPPQLDVAGQLFLEGSNGKCKIVRLGCIENQRVILTQPGNLTYGTESMNDMKNLKPFNSGSPYHFTATMKYTFGVQLESIHHRKFITNKLYAES